MFLLLQICCRQTWLCCSCPTDTSSSLTRRDITSYAASLLLTLIQKDSIKFLFIWLKRNQLWIHTVNIHLYSIYSCIVNCWQMKSFISNQWFIFALQIGTEWISLAVTIHCTVFRHVYSVKVLLNNLWWSFANRVSYVVAIFCLIFAKLRWPALTAVACNGCSMAVKFNIWPN